MHRTVERMLRTNPERPIATPDMLASCIQACMACAQACTACADACIAEHERGQLDHCIRLNLDCADICGATVRIMSRQDKPDLGLIAMVLELCTAACHACATECERHAQAHMYCHVCAAVCHECEEACRQLLPDTAERGRLHH